MKQFILVQIAPINMSLFYFGIILFIIIYIIFRLISHKHSHDEVHTKVLRKKDDRNAGKNLDK